MLLLFFLIHHGDPRHLLSFPTRRSSDLVICRFALPPAAGLDTPWVCRFQAVVVLSSGQGPHTSLPCGPGGQDRKSTRLNSSHMSISYAVFCLKKKKVN